MAAEEGWSAMNRYPARATVPDEDLQNANVTPIRDHVAWRRFRRRSGVGQVAAVPIEPPKGSARRHAILYVQTDDIPLMLGEASRPNSLYRWELEGDA